MIVFPNSKINLGLRIVRKRDDGFHDLETVFYPLNIFDALELIPAKDQPGEQSIELSSSGIQATTNPNDNICLKAYRLLATDFPAKLSSLQLHLHKAIPIGAGLGGGSADGAFTLCLLNRQFDLGLTEDQLVIYALQLGSDCAFFIINKPCIGKGRGELLEEIALDLSAYKFLIVNPAIHIQTGKAFSNIVPAKPDTPISYTISQPVNTWKDNLINDFEETVFQDHPTIEKIKDDLYLAGAVYSSMSGSGSTVYGLFKKETSIEVSFPPHYFCRELIG